MKTFQNLLDEHEARINSAQDNLIKVYSVRTSVRTEGNLQQFLEENKTAFNDSISESRQMLYQEAGLSSIMIETPEEVKIKDLEAKLASNFSYAIERLKFDLANQ